MIIVKSGNSSRYKRSRRTFLHVPTSERRHDKQKCYPHGHTLTRFLFYENQLEKFAPQKNQKKEP